MWDQRYSISDYFYGKLPNQFLSEHAHVIPQGSRVLAAADGEGRNGVWLAEQRLSVLSVDASCVAQTKAKQLAEERGVQLEFACVDLLTWDWPQEAFDAVVCVFIQFVAGEDRERLFEGIRRTTRPGGLVLLQGYTPRQLDYRTGGPGHPDNMYTEAWLRAAFSGWEVVHLREHDSHIAEGHGHHGMSALIDLIVRKPS